jgi:hypothetical protein
VQQAPPRKDGIISGWECGFLHKGNEVNKGDERKREMDGVLVSVDERTEKSTGLSGFWPGCPGSLNSFCRIVFASLSSDSEFLTNELDPPAGVIVELYRKRREAETAFD